MSGPVVIGRDVARALAEALSYPDPGLPGRLRVAAARVAGAAGPTLRTVADRLEALGPAAAEELYTATFDVRPAVSPYVSDHLHLEGARRNALLAWLTMRYADAGLAPGREVPDHFAEVLRYLAATPDGEDRDDLAALALVPAARSAASTLSPGHPYRAAFDALLGATAPGPELPVPEEAAP